MSEASSFHDCKELSVSFFLLDLFLLPDPIALLFCDTTVFDQLVEKRICRVDQLEQAREILL